VADLFCGTGTLGLEALSEGAAKCCFAERDRKVVHRLKRNIQTLGLEDRCEMWHGDVQVRLASWLAGLDAPIDVAFVDPPYALVRRWDWRRAEQTIFAPLAEHLAGDGLVVLRLPKRVDCPRTLGRLRIYRHREYGDMKLELFRRAESE